MGKLEEDPKCSGIVWREVVRLITHGPVVYQLCVIRFFPFFFFFLFHQSTSSRYEHISQVSAALFDEL